MTDPMTTPTDLLARLDALGRETTDNCYFEAEFHRDQMFLAELLHAWRSGELRQALVDSDRLAAVAEMDSIAINKWLVQVCGRSRYGWSAVYFDDPPAGVPEYKAASRLDALREAIDTARALCGDGMGWQGE